MITPGFLIWSGLVSLVANLIIGFSVLATNPKQKANRYFALLSLCVGGWSSGSFFLNASREPEMGLLLLRYSYFLGVWVPSIYLHFVYLLSDEIRTNLKMTLRICYAVSFFFALFVFTPLFISDIHIIQETNFKITSPGLIYYGFFVFFSVVMLGVLMHTFNQLKLYLHQSHFLFIAAANCMAVLAGFEYFVRVFGFMKSPPWDDYILVVYAVLLAFAVVRWRLFSADELANLIRRDKLIALGTISSSINHEIRNPLYVVNGLAQSFLESVREGRRENVEKKAEEAMQKISEQSVRAMDIIKRFSSFAKQNVDAEFKPESVSLSEVLKTVNPLVEHELESKNIVLKEEIASNLPSIQADPRHLEEILFNLIVNAAQAIASVEKSGEIVIKAYSEKESVVIEVLDNGPGIAAEELDRVFEPFHTSKAEGTGLGLYITKQLVEKNGGRITVNSKLNNKTVFKIIFKSCL